jgi:hypothetical protein
MLHNESIHTVALLNIFKRHAEGYLNTVQSVKLLLYPFLLENERFIRR